MPCWYYEKTRELRNTPSIQDGIEYDTECRYRREGARFIIDTGSKMDLGYNTVATGVVFFHRFYMFHSFRNFPRYVTACCCLFLAGKVEETPKKCKDIIKIAQTLLTKQEFMTFGKDPKEEVVTLERILLQTIKFDLQVEHPYSYLLTYAKCLKGDKIKLQEMVQRAWNFVNDSLCTTLSLQWEPEIIAIALMYLAGKLSKFEVKDWNGRQLQHLRWWDMFVEDVRMDLLEDICHQMLDHYSQADNARPPDSPPLVTSSEVNRDRIVTPPIVETATAAPNGSCLSWNGQPTIPPQTDSAHACLDQWVRLDGPSTNPWSVCRNGLWRNVAAVTPSKVPKVEPVVVPANGCPPAEPIEPIRPLDIPSHFTLYPTGYTPAPMGFPPVFPLTNISVPPPPVTINHHIVSAMRHLGPAGTIRPSPLNPAPGQPIPPYGYRPNATYFSSANLVPPTNVQRPYYPPQP